MNRPLVALDVISVVCIFAGLIGRPFSIHYFRSLVFGCLISYYIWSLILLVIGFQWCHFGCLFLVRYFQSFNFDCLLLVICFRSSNFNRRFSQFYLFVHFQLIIIGRLFSVIDFGWRLSVVCFRSTNFGCLLLVGCFRSTNFGCLLLVVCVCFRSFNFGCLILVVCFPSSNFKHLFPNIFVYPFSVHYFWLPFFNHRSYVFGRLFPYYFRSPILSLVHFRPSNFGCLFSVVYHRSSNFNRLFLQVYRSSVFSQLLLVVFFCSSVVCFHTLFAYLYCSLFVFSRPISVVYYWSSVFCRPISVVYYWSSVFGRPISFICFWSSNFKHLFSQGYSFIHFQSIIFGCLFSIIGGTFSVAYFRTISVHLYCWLFIFEHPISVFYFRSSLIGRPIAIVYFCKYIVRSFSVDYCWLSLFFGHWSYVFGRRSSLIDEKSDVPTF